ncbi:Nucleoside-diphosphate-sugar epimerase [Mariprofundus aestuarium]|uniref:Nucleoside-diphosphate-sugar epimerase n=1 Tax=Mariprofundus aestuarium TaxID=1921086 RepID=A0A2K8KZF6_MARES|nr:SDR family oxidoreductase [Mariprofundus aestuarium]ATX78921.1 Nucleoside-diphosphate-sugar epimerase [Mariprofundus aestuarium]
MTQSIDSLLIFGCGYVGERLAKACIAEGIRGVATTRSENRANELEALGVEAVVVSSPADLSDRLLASVHAVLDSIPLTRSEQGMHASQVEWLPLIAAKMRSLKWAGYLSTTGVYGDANGAWVDEAYACHPSSARGTERLIAETSWLESGMPSEVFRLAGIYGPERNILARLQAGGYKAVQWQPPHWSNRIHVDDIVAAVMSAMQNPSPGRIVNLADDEPLPHADYVTELARLAGAPEPVLLSEQAGEKELSPMALEFFRDNKRISNRLLHHELLAELKYPSFRDAVADLKGSEA